MSSAPVRRFFVGGNWKCNGGVEAVGKLVKGLNESTAGLPAAELVEVVVAPPALYLDSCKRTLDARFAVSAQNCYHKKGAFTGELAAEHLTDFGIRWVILGHSERRHVFGEKDDLLGLKASAAVAAGLNVIYCIGELLDERKANKTEAVIEAQMAALAKVITSPEQWAHIVVAYEPVWAIGTGVTATPAQAQEAHAFTRKWVAEHVSRDVAASIRILYGGSVTPQNASELAVNPDVDGFLVGGASLEAAKFVPIINSVLAKRK